MDRALPVLLLFPQVDHRQAAGKGPADQGDHDRGGHLRPALYFQLGAALHARSYLPESLTRFAHFPSVWRYPLSRSSIISILGSRSTARNILFGSAILSGVLFSVTFTIPLSARSAPFPYSE